MITIEEIRKLCGQSKIKWSAHASARIQQRGISRQDILNCVMGGEIIEQYPDHWLNPACLIFGYNVNNRVIHVVAGLDDYVHIVTAYYPNEEKFESDLRTRKER